MATQNGPHPLPAHLPGERHPFRKCRGCNHLQGVTRDWDNYCSIAPNPMVPTMSRRITRYSDYFGPITPSWCPYLKGDKS